MNIALVCDLPPGGGAFRVLAEYVAERPGHAFTLYTPRPQTASLVALSPQVRVVRMDRPAPRGGHWGALWGLPARGRELAALVDAGGHDAALVLPTELVGGSEVLPALRTPALTYVPEALRIAYEPEPSFGAPTGLRARLTRRGLNPYERKRKALDAAHVRAADRVVVHSQFTAATVRDAYAVEPAVVPLGVRADDFAGAEAARERRVLAVGALHPLKGHQFVIEAVGTIPVADRPPVTIVGDRGALADRLLALAATLGVELELLQAIPFAEVVRQYHRAGVFAGGQLREPFGLVTLEAMAAGLPVVTVDEGGFRETVRDGVTGLRVARDPQAFGGALLRVLDDPVLAERLAAAGLEDALGRWTWDRTASGVDALLAELVR